MGVEEEEGCSEFGLEVRFKIPFHFQTFKHLFLDLHTIPYFIIITDAYKTL